MKNNMLILACLSTTLAHGMETNSENKTDSFSIVSHATNINLARKSLFDIDDKVELIIVGTRQQDTLQKPNPITSFRRRPAVGTITYSPDKIIYEANPYSTKKKLWKDPFKQKMPCDVMSIVEPFVDMECNDFAYGDSTIKNPKSCQQEFANEAIILASEHAMICYQTALEEGVKKEKKSIAITTLGADVGFFPQDKAAELAVTTILEFIKKNHDAYARIELIVKEESVFELYKNLLQQYAENK